MLAFRMPALAHTLSSLFASPAPAIPGPAVAPANHVPARMVDMNLIVLGRTVAANIAEPICYLLYAHSVDRLPLRFRVVSTISTSISPPCIML